MGTILNLIKRLEKLNQEVIERNLFKALKEAKAKIETLNIQQLEKGQDIEGNIVGLYAFDTERFAELDNIQTKKTFGAPYNFNWFGEFFEGFELVVTDDSAVIISTGMGSGEKKEFLTSKELLGLNDDNLKLVIRENVLPFIQRFIKKTLL